MRNKKEYELCKSVANYLRLQYPKVMFHFDLAGLNLSKAQAGMMKAIQGSRGWPDLFIAGCNEKYKGLFIELNIESPFKHDGTLKKDSHLEEQQRTLQQLWDLGYGASFGVGFRQCKEIIDNYMNLK